MSSVKEATRAYEHFLRDRLAVVESDLDFKHEQMHKALFPFLRSTFYRWSVLFREVCGELAEAPALLAVGDLHVENFGTWRDLEGRLIWGVNDVDEAQFMPYPIDLVRLATSALLASEEGKLGLVADSVAEALLAGYGEWLEAGGLPFVLEEEHGWLRQLATGALRDPTLFWGKMVKLPDAAPPKSVAELMTRHLPKGAVFKRFASRVAGLGSLGRPRFVVLADLQGAHVTREAKAMLPSAWSWSLGEQGAALRCGESLSHAVRCNDPWLDFVVEGKGDAGWVIRRLAPLCSRVELADLPHARDPLRLLRAMGRETANIHLGSPERLALVKADLAKRPAGWLAKASVAMAKATERDWHDWRS